MALKTNIEWCDSTVNPAPCCTGCELFPEHCYAAAMCRRYAGRPGWPKSFTTPTLFPKRVIEAAKWPDLTGTKRADKPWLDGRPRMIFLNDLGDVFAPFDGDLWKPKTHWLNALMQTIEQSPHIWLVLTKWPKRLAEFAYYHGPMPANVWWGTTATGQKYRDRIWQLLKTPQLAARFLSYEPAIGPLDLYAIDALCKTWRRGATLGIYLDWVIVGGESGPGARPMHPDWARTIRDQCAAVGVPFFFKQWGEWVQHPCAKGYAPFHERFGVGYFAFDGDTLMDRAGKKAGRLLDGREWNEMPGTKIAN